MEIFIDPKMHGFQISDLEGKIKKFEVGELLFESDSVMAGDYIGFITKGVAKFSLNSPDGKNRVVYFLSPSATVGEMALISGRKYPHNLTVVAMTPMEVYFVSKHTLLRSFKEKPEVAYFVLTVFSEKLSILLDYLNGDSFYDSFTMTCSALLALKNEEQKIEMSHKQLSEIIGVNRVTVSYALKKLQDMGAIKQKRNLIIVNNIEMIESKIKKKFE